MEREHVTLTDLERAGMSERDICFQVWALQADRSPKRTADILLRDYGITIDTGKISVWAGRYDWPVKARELFSDVAPSFIERTAASLVGGAPDAAAFLIAASRGEPSATLDNGMVDRGRVVASVAVLDRVGFLPHTRKDAERSGTPVQHRGNAHDDTLTDQDLARIIAERVAMLTNGAS